MQMKHKIKKHLQKTAEIITSLDLDELSVVATQLKTCFSHNGVVYTCGNGGSGSTASHFSGDIMKGLSYGKHKRLKSICLNDNITSMMALANDVSYADIFVELLKNVLTPNDMLITFSGSGNSQNIVNAIKYSNKCGAFSVAICGFNGGQAKQLASASIHANINDMEIAENVHVSIFHALKVCFM